jgi:tetratricopeptide (TPR) repeat protein
MTLSRFEDAAADFRQAEQAARDCGDRENEVKAICDSARALYYLNRLGETVEQGRRALELARATGSDVCVASAELVLAKERLCVGALPAAVEYFDRAVPILKSHGAPIQALDAVASSGMIHTWRLEYQKAHRVFDWTAQRSRELGACISMLGCLFFKGMALGNQGRLSDAMSAVREGIRLAELNGERFWLSRLPNTLGWIHREAQDFETALRLDSENVTLAREADFPEGEANSLVNLGHDYLSLGEADRAFEHLQEAATIYKQDVWYRWRYNTRLQAELARYWIVKGSLKPATNHAIACLKSAEASQSYKYIAWAHKVLGDIASLEDRVEDARREYGIAMQVVEAHPCPTTHWRILKARADLASKLKDSAAADEFRGRARKVIDGLVDSVREAPLREKFLTSQAIRDL